jgi:hypothetical protein
MVVAVPSPVPVMSPAHFFGLETIDIVLRYDRGLGGVDAWWHKALFRPNRRQHCGLRARSKHGAAGSYSKGEFQKTTAFHGISSFAQS